MFTELAELVAKSSLHLIITAEADSELKVMVFPKSQDGKNPALSQPLILIAKPEELDEKFASVLTQYKTARKSLEETLAETTAYMDAAGKAARETAANAAKATKPAPATVPKKEEAPAASAEETEEDDFTLF